MNFDTFGNLLPYEIIHIDSTRFETIFVDNFTISTSRRSIFNNYLAFTEVLKNNLQTPFYQWIDGSFVTSKQNPNDIDIVTFIPYLEYEKNIGQLQKITGLAYLKNTSIDSYFVKLYPEESENYQYITKLDTLEWLHLFSKTRVQRDGRKYAKGIIQINFDD